MRDDNAAVSAGTDAQPHMTVHAEDIAGTERGWLLQAVAAVLTGKGTPGSLGKRMGKLGGGRDIAITVGDRRTLGMQGIVQRPAEVARAIQTGIAVLVPAAGRVVAVRGIAVVAVGLAGVLTVEEVNPALWQTNVHSGVAGAGILPVPAAAVDVQGGADRHQGGSEQVLQGALTGNTVNRRMIHLRSRPDIRNTVEYLCITADDPAGEKARQNDSAAGSCADFKHSAAGKVHAVYRDGIAADGIDYALCIRTAENSLCHRSLPDGQMIRLTFLQAVLDGVAAFIAHGIAAHAVALPKPMRKPVFILGTDAAVALYA